MSLLKISHYDYAHDVKKVSVINASTIFEISEYNTKESFSKDYPEQQFCRISCNDGSKYLRHFDIPGTLDALIENLKYSFNVTTLRGYKDPRGSSEVFESHQMSELMKVFGNGNVVFQTGEQSGKSSGSISLMTGNTAVESDPFYAANKELVGLQEKLKEVDDSFDKNYKAIQNTMSLQSSEAISPGLALITNGDPSKSVVITNLRDE